MRFIMFGIKMNSILFILNSIMLIIDIKIDSTLSILNSITNIIDIRIILKLLIVLKKIGSMILISKWIYIHFEFNYLHN